MNRPKLLLLAATVAVSASALSACGGSHDQSNVTGNNGLGATTTLPASYPKGSGN
ncbi:hypothetical protein K6U06_01915 [Acidiferrimicrobium sp. IK]|uniref:hypothetical protein n=1 Tax=Acidiferrimicrobium sp. IK TaxID=2871700 RepID=UPI0021CB620B|nr:hypothetical protein [Acidiferrimicrobium sp. IK]MCU4183100.1 hypothetical protein [Acidiferrimicrobium sp. IK]